MIATIHGDLAEFKGRRVSARATAAGALDAYIRSLVEYVRDHRAEMSAATEISVNFRPEGGAALSEAATSTSTLSHLERLLARGQESGEFGTFNRRVMVTALQRALDGLPFLLEADADLDEYADEPAALFARATRP
ncbi:hypothetical protein E1286_18645 [Nonomuraea terrae]|uniref:Uncharacterized protein n=1 Tax=Nonomuraea terrae TaxID=2530383 RepID=A0A4R4YPP1_9ACTN|nr:hypothetical protein [Nonomuraea terrae]TDD47081.1 hypothetical protein E1286_18645 [Nonomuraea terrae]